MEKIKSLEPKTQIILAVIAAGFLFLGVALFLNRWKMNASETEIRLGRVERERGETFIHRNSTQQKEKVRGKAFIYNLDSIQTNEIGQAQVVFETGEKILVLENSILTIERIDNEEDFSVLVILKKGDLRVDESTETSTLQISKNGDRVKAFDYNNSVLAKSDIKSPESFDPELPTEPIGSQGLSEAEINEKFTQNKSSFFKCYTQVIQKDPSIKGEVALSFTIENNGKLSVAEVVSSQIKNEDFKKCLVDVLKRLEFRNFSGPPISTLLPMNFDQ